MAASITHTSPAAAVIFDLDGLLADTETLHCAAYRSTLAEFGVQLSEAEYAEHWILNGYGIADLFAQRKLPLDAGVVRNRKAAVYAELVASSARPMPGAVELLQRLHGRRTLALASSSYRSAIAAVMAALNAGHFFAAVAGNEDVRQVKPAPDLFLHVAALLDAPPARCVVLEDSQKGVAAAHAAGMACIAVPNRHTSAHDFSLAKRVVPSLHAVTLELIDSLAANV